MRMLLAAAILTLGLAAPQGGAPINTTCPVKPKQKAKASLTVVYEGQIIGFC